MSGLTTRLKNCYELLSWMKTAGAIADSVGWKSALSNLMQLNPGARAATR
jgi:hypothetical protein